MTAATQPSLENYRQNASPRPPGVINHGVPRSISHEHLAEPSAVQTIASVLQIRARGKTEFKRPVRQAARKQWIQFGFFHFIRERN